METERGCSAVSGTTWEELEKEIFTPEEIAESDRRVAEMSRAIRDEADHSAAQLRTVTGVNGR